MALDEDVDINIEVNKAGMHPFSKNGRRFGFTLAAIVFFLIVMWFTMDFTSALAVAAIPIGIGTALVGINPFGVELVWHALTDRISKLEI